MCIFKFLKSLVSNNSKEKVLEDSLSEKDHEEMDDLEFDEMNDVWDDMDSN